MSRVLQRVTRGAAGFLLGLLLLAIVWVLDSAGEDTRVLEDRFP